MIEALPPREIMQKAELLPSTISRRAADFDVRKTAEAYLRVYAEAARSR